MTTHTPCAALKSTERSCRLIVIAFLAFVFVTSMRAAEPLRNAGSIEGRVFNTRTGQYVEKARLTIEGTALETFTDNLGQYFFPSVPAGEVNVKAFYTGLESERVSVRINTGQSTKQDFNLAGFDAKLAQAAGTVKLSEFVVSTSRQMDGAAIAINEQRFAPNIKNVVAADEFGPVADHGVGEILKFLPGIALEYNAGNSRGVGINGVPSDYVPLTVNGFDMASAQNNRPVQRTVDLLLVSTNNLSRMEVVYSPTPESPGMALGGSVNMVMRNAFERSKPQFNSTLYLFVPDDEIHLSKEPGARSKPTHTILPGADLSLVVPVNQRFGFTVSANAQRQYQHTDDSTYTWRGAGAATDGVSFPDTTVDKPYLTTFILKDTPKDTTRFSYGGTFDFKISARDQVSLSLQYVRVIELFGSTALTFNLTRVLPGEFGPSFTHGSSGTGQLTLASDAAERTTTSFMPTLTYRHNGPVWKAEAGLGYSRSNALLRDLSKGYMSNVTARRTGVTILFDDVSYSRPGSIKVSDPVTGAAVDPYDINSYVITTTTGGHYRDGVSVDSLDVKRSAFANVAREFPWRFPVMLKAGIDVRQSKRDNQQGRGSYNFVGADGRPSTTPTGGTDGGAAAVLDKNMSQRGSGLGFPRFDRPGWEETWRLLQDHPTYFTKNVDADYRGNVNFSKAAEEIISAAFVRGDLEFFDRRLKLVSGLRAEQTNVTAQGPLTDVTRNYQRDASGRVLLGSNGRPLTITTDPFSITKLTLIERGQHTDKEYLRLFPSINASYKLRENLIARAAYYYSVGRPNFNQYAGGLTLPDTETGPSATNRITVNNAAIKAWSAKTAKVTLEYYFEGVGLFSIGAYRREFENFFGNIEFAATPQFLSLYGLDPSVYGQYNVVTQQNLDSPVRMDGLEFNYKQALTFLPRWARGVQVFANGNTLRAMGAPAANFAGFIPRTASGGISLNRQKYSLSLSANYRSRARLTLFSGRGLEADTFAWMAPQLFVDFSGSYSLSKHFNLFWTARNVTSDPYDTERFGPHTPAIARLQDRRQFDSIWTFGIRSSF